MFSVQMCFIHQLKNIWQNTNCRKKIYKKNWDDKEQLRGELLYNFIINVCGEKKKC